MLLNWNNSEVSLFNDSLNESSNFGLCNCGKNSFSKTESDVNGLLACLRLFLSIKSVYVIINGSIT